MKLIPGLNSLCSVEGLPAIHEVGVWPRSRGAPMLMLLAEYLAQLGLILCSAANFFLTTANHLHVHHFLISKMWIIIPT